MLAVWRTVYIIIHEKEVSPIVEVRNLKGKRVCDISSDGRVVWIVQKGCITTICANPDGTLKIVHYDE